MLPRFLLFLVCGRLSDFGGTPAGAAVVKIISSRDIGFCLAVDDNWQLIVKDCLSNGVDMTHARWEADGWEPGRVHFHGSLCLAESKRCLIYDDGQLKASTKEDPEKWRWDVENLRLLHVSAQKGYLRSAVSHIGGQLQLQPPQLHTCSADCNSTRVSAFRNDIDENDTHARVPVEQNGWGEADSTWIFAPLDTPQLDILDKLELPLRVNGRYFIDQTGNRVKLVGVNWFGAHMEQLVNNGLDRTTAERIALQIKHLGFNSVRLNYALTITDTRNGSFIEVPHRNLVKGDPQLENLSALEVFDHCVEALTDIGLLVIINVHMSNAGWCCDFKDGNGLWYNKYYDEASWFESLEFMADRYKHNQRVIGFDLRNEPRARSDSDEFQMAWWGVPERMESILHMLTGFELKDWRVAAAKGSVATWKGNPDALVFVEGVNYAMHLKFVLKRKMNFADDCLFSRVAYENHDYPYFNFLPFAWFKAPFAVTGQLTDDVFNQGGSEDEADVSGKEEHDSYDCFKDTRIASYLFLDVENKAPVWTGEFGTMERNSTFWVNEIRLYKEQDSNWCFWPLDPIKYPPNVSDQHPFGVVDPYGIFDAHYGDYKAVVGWKVQDLISIQAPVRVARLPKPSACAFRAEANEAAASETTSFVEIFETTDVTTLLVLKTLVLLCFCPCLICWGCVARQCLTTSGKAKDDASTASEYALVNDSNMQTHSQGS